MINPNKDYKVKNVGTIINIDAPEAYIPYVKVKMEDGRLLEGNLARAYSNPSKLSVGQMVNVWVQWSITSDKPMISRLTRKLK